jgi:pimeloyl-ACP methyl ester carboxylesterase
MKPLTFKYTAATPGEKSDILSVYIDGLGSSQRRPGMAITALLNDDSDLLAIDLPADNRFSKKNVLQAIHNHDRYREHRGTIRIIGLSMGALLGHDLIEHSKARRMVNQFELVVIDAPTGLSDIKDQRAKWLKYVPAMLPLWFIKPQDDGKPLARYEADITKKDMAALIEHDAISRAIPFPGWLRHMKYLIAHKGPRSSVLTGVNMVIMQSTNDSYIMQPQAHDKWQGTRGVPIAVVEVESPDHGLLMEFPNVYADALNEALDILFGMSKAA